MVLDKEEQILRMQWHGFVPTDVVINAYIELGRYMKINQYVPLKGLVDLTYAEGSFERHNDWMIKEYLPKAVEYGYYRTAFVRSKDYFPNLALIFFEEENEKNLKEHEMKIFNTAEDAEIWLKS